MKIFITGASGFIGSNLLRRCASYGSEVIGLSRETSRGTDKNITFVKGDILEPDSIRSHLEGVEVLFHCAAYISFDRRSYKKAYKVNVEGTKNILEIALKNNIKKFVHLSACATLGYTKNNTDILNEQSNISIPGTNIYGYTKKLSEELARNYAKKGLDVSIASIATVYGQGDRKMNSGGIIQAIYENKIKFAPPGGTSYVGINDLVDGLILLSENGRCGERYIFCNENLSFSELFNRIAGAIGRREISFIIPKWTYAPVVAAAWINNTIHTSSENRINLATPQIIRESYYYKYYSSQKARDELGWKPREPLEDAVRDALKFYKERGLIIDKE